VGREVTGFRLSQRQLDLLDESSVSRSEMVRFLVESGLGSRPDLVLVADVLSDLAENSDSFSRGQQELLFRTVSVLRGVAQREGEQVSLEQALSEGGDVGLEEGKF